MLPITAGLNTHPIGTAASVHRIQPVVERQALTKHKELNLGSHFQPKQITVHRAHLSLSLLMVTSSPRTKKTSFLGLLSKIL